MSETPFWALRPTSAGPEIWTENGERVAVFFDAAIAERLVEDHNIDADMEREENDPVVQKTQEELQAARIAHYRQNEPEQPLLLAQIAESANRILRLLSLNAPEIIVADAASHLADRAAAFSALHPFSADDDESALPETQGVNT